MAEPTGPAERVTQGRSAPGFLIQRHMVRTPSLDQVLAGFMAHCAGAREKKLSVYLHET